MKTEKRCPKCDLVKPFSEFYRQGRSYSGWCKECTKARSQDQSATGYHRERRRQAASKRKPKQRLTPTELLANEAFKNARNRSMRNGLSFDLTVEWVRKQFIEFCANNHHQLTPKKPFRPSLDRIEPKQGYVQSNVRVIWLIENYARNEFTDEQVIEFCKRKLGLF